MPLCLGEGFRGEAGMPSAASLPSAGWKRAPHGARPVLERRRNSCALTRSAPPQPPGSASAASPGDGSGCPEGWAAGDGARVGGC